MHAVLGHVLGQGRHVLHRVDVNALRSRRVGENDQGEGLRAEIKAEPQRCIISAHLSSKEGDARAKWNIGAGACGAILMPGGQQTEFVVIKGTRTLYPPLFWPRRSRRVLTPHSVPPRNTTTKMGMLDGLFGSEGGGDAGDAGDILGGGAPTEPTPGGEANN